MGRSAYFNLNRLGASVIGYVPDMYGNTNPGALVGERMDIVPGAGTIGRMAVGFIRGREYGRYVLKRGTGSMGGL